MDFCWTHGRWSLAMRSATVLEFFSTAVPYYQAVRAAIATNDVISWRKDCMQDKIAHGIRNMKRRTLEKNHLSYAVKKALRLGSVGAEVNVKWNRMHNLDVCGLWLKATGRQRHARHQMLLGAADLNCHLGGVLWQFYKLVHYRWWCCSLQPSVTVCCPHLKHLLFRTFRLNQPLSFWV